MSNLISGKEALIALANGKTVEVKRIHDNEWQPAQIFGVSVFTDSETTSFRLKPHTITINEIEVPAPFEPKDGDTVFIPVNFLQQGYIECKYPTFEDHCYQFGSWRSEDEIKQVVEVLRGMFNGKN